MTDTNTPPFIGITMGDPCGIGPEIVISALSSPDLYACCRPVVIGDDQVLAQAAQLLKRTVSINRIDHISQAQCRRGTIDVLSVSRLDLCFAPGFAPTPQTGKAMHDYIVTGVDLAMKKQIHAVVTCPITKTAMKLAGSRFHGHTELIAHQTGTADYAMMMAGNSLKVVLVTIHIPLARVCESLGKKNIATTIRITHNALQDRFGIRSPHIAVAGLNPHAGEDEMFGSEEKQIIIPAVNQALKNGIKVTGPLPPDTIFQKAVDRQFDAVVCMYHDQGLIPFKLLHFKDGVNTTLGLPIIRTSVDHGTAYDIAWKGVADETSLTEAIKMAAFQAGQTKG
jgi:4-hydroxythreonine-4-phosphate dehydrogenase